MIHAMRVANTAALTLIGDNDPDVEVPGYRNIVIYCDESGMHRAPYYGFGSVWMPWERRGSLSGIIGQLRAKHRYRDEAKWSSVNKHSLPFYRELVSAFFERSWLMFHSIVFCRADVASRLHASLVRRDCDHFNRVVRAERFDAVNVYLVAAFVWIALEEGWRLLESPADQPSWLRKQHMGVLYHPPHQPVIPKVLLLDGCAVDAGEWNEVAEPVWAPIERVLRNDHYDVRPNVDLGHGHEAYRFLCDRGNSELWASPDDLSKPALRGHGCDSSCSRWICVPTGGTACIT